MRAWSWMLCAAALAVGCTEGQEQPATLEPVTTPGGELPVLPDPDLQDGNVGRAPRRITVEQLRRSIELAVGRPWTGLESVADALGEADFAQVVTEATEPNLVFAKFLEDGARSVCVAQANADLAAATAAERILARHLPDSLTDLTALTAAEHAANLQYLSTRFWGWPLQGAELAAWTSLAQQLSTRAQAANRRSHALAGLCIALLTDPRFSTY